MDLPPEVVSEDPVEQNISDFGTQNAVESLFSTVSDIASSTGHHLYTREVLLSLSQLLRLLANSPASPLPDVELGYIDRGRGNPAIQLSI